MGCRPEKISAFFVAGKPVHPGDAIRGDRGFLNGFKWVLGTVLSDSVTPPYILHVFFVAYRN